MIIDRCCNRLDLSLIDRIEGNSECTITHCPWCGTKFKPKIKRYRFNSCIDDLIVDTTNQLMVRVKNGEDGVNYWIPREWIEEVP